MPEGDTVHKLAQALGPVLVGARVGRVETGRPARRRDGLTVEGVRAVGKHLWMVFADTGGTRVSLRTHLGMWGSWQQIPFDRAHADAADVARWRRREHERTPPVTLWLEDRLLVCWQPKEVEWRPGYPPIMDGRTGPDLTSRPRAVVPDPRAARALVRGQRAGRDGSAACSSDWLSAWLEALRASTPEDRLMADVLLDQRLAAGIGNVYKNELLFLHRVHPVTPIGRVDDARLAALYRDAQTLLRRNLHYGPRITRRTAEAGEHLWVYGRGRAPCRVCGTPIEWRLLGEHQRSTYFCPTCQPAPRGVIVPPRVVADPATRNHRRPRPCA